MKKTAIMIILMALTLQSFAPNGPILSEPPLPEPEITVELCLEPLIKAITFLESTHGLYTFNEAEGAVGWFQIRQIRVDDYNKRTKSTYKLIDFFDYDLSKEMFLYYAQMYDDWETIAKRWNGSGPMTEIYWDKVTAYLNSMP